MAGFGGSPVANLFSGLGENIREGALTYQDILRQRQQQNYVAQLMSLAAAREGREVDTHEFEQSLNPFRYKVAAQEPLMGDLRLRTGEEALTGAQETRALGGQYREGLMGEGVSPTSAIAAFLGRPQGAAVLAEPEMIDLDILGKKTDIGYKRALTGQVGRSGGGGDGGSDVEAAAGRLTNETLQGIITQAQRKRFHGQSLTPDEERLAAAAYGTLLARQRELKLAEPGVDDVGDPIGGGSLLPGQYQNPFLPQP